MNVRSTLLPICLAALTLVNWTAIGIAQEGPVFRDIDDVAILGYDPVAYFTVSEPVKGAPDHNHEWLDASWWFTNADHRDLFLNDPDKYAPQFGGNCTMGLATGFREAIDPTVWTIIEGRLYLFQDPKKLEEFEKDPDLYLTQAKSNWQRLRRLQ